MPSAQASHHSPAVLILIDVINHFEFPDGQQVLRRGLRIAPKPNKDDYFVLKPMHSGFDQTPLEVLLRYLNASTRVLAGLTTSSRLVCTAHDAKMREFELYVPSDCSAAQTVKEHRQAIESIPMMTDAKVTPAASLRLNELAREFRANNNRHGVRNL